MDIVDGPVAVTNDAPAIFPVGITTVIFSATDAAGNTGVAASTVTVEPPNEPPVAAAGFVPIEVEEDEEGIFEIVATATDPNNNLDTVVAVIETPDPDGLDLQLEVHDRVKVEFDFDDSSLLIKVPDPQAILDQMVEFGGIVVQSGQITEIEIDDEDELERKFEEDGTLKIEGPLPTLRVFATDAEGAFDVATAAPAFESEEEEEEEEEDQPGEPQPSGPDQPGGPEGSNGYDDDDEEEEEEDQPGEPQPSGPDQPGGPEGPNGSEGEDDGGEDGDDDDDD